MGHALAYVTLTLADAEEARKNIAGPPRDRFRFGQRTLASEMVTRAAQQWRDNEAGRYDDECLGAGFITEVMPSATINGYVDRNYQRIAERSVVIPIAKEADVIEKKVKAKVPVDAVQLAAVRRAMAGLGVGSQATGMTSELHQRVAAQFGAAMVSARVITVPAARKPVATVTEGRAVTVYEVHGLNALGQAAVIASCSTQANALAEAIRILTEDPRQASLTVRARVVRETENGKHNADLVVVSRPAAADATVTVEVTLQTVKPNTQPAEYVVMFDYHH